MNRLAIPISGIIVPTRSEISVKIDAARKGFVVSIDGKEIDVKFPDDFRPLQNGRWLVFANGAAYRISSDCDFSRSVHHIYKATKPPPLIVDEERGNLISDLKKSISDAPKQLYHAPSEQDEMLIKSGQIAFKPSFMLRQYSDPHEGVEDKIIGREKTQDKKKDIIISSGVQSGFCAFCMSKTQEGAMCGRKGRNLYEVNVPALSNCVAKSLKKGKGAAFYYDFDGAPCQDPKIMVTALLREVEYRDEDNQDGMGNFGQWKQPKYSHEQEVRIILIFLSSRAKNNSLTPKDPFIVEVDFSECFRKIKNSSK